MRIKNELERVIESGTGVPSKGQLLVENTYRHGIFKVEFILGGQKVMVRLVKQE